jgi:hypothetical protein
MMGLVWLAVSVPPKTLAGFDLATLNSAGRDDTARPHRRGMLGYILAIGFLYVYNWRWKILMSVELYIY